MYEKRWECPICKDARGKPRTITTDDFENYYTKKPDFTRTNVVNLNDTRVLENW